MKVLCILIYTIVCVNIQSFQPSCTKCKHFSKELPIDENCFGYCKRYHKIEFNQFVYEYAQRCRNSTDKCGPDGKYFEKAWKYNWFLSMINKYFKKKSRFY
jgi:hypothetical protein